MINKFTFNLLDNCLVNTFTLLVIGCTCTKYTFMNKKIELIYNKSAYTDYEMPFVEDDWIDIDMPDN